MIVQLTDKQNYHVFVNFDNIKFYTPCNLCENDDFTANSKSDGIAVKIYFTDGTKLVVKECISQIQDIINDSRLH